MERFIDLCDELLDQVVGGDPLVCGALQAAGAPGAVNMLPSLGMDADDCDLYVGGERFIDFVPYED